MYGLSSKVFCRYNPAAFQKLETRYLKMEKLIEPRDKS
jgi:hypothetical protein